MEKVISIKNRKISVNSIISFFIFFICMLKHYFINILELVPKYGNINRMIGFLLILPLTIFGFVISAVVIFNNFKRLKSDFRIIEIILILPLLFFIYYFFIFL